MSGQSKLFGRFVLLEDHRAIERAYEDRLSHLRVALENARIAVYAERWDEFEEIVNEAFKYDHARAV